MYLHSTYQLLNPITPIKEYRTQLKEISKINLRRSSKFNLLAVYGALKCSEKLTFSDNLGIYVATEYGPIMDVRHAMETVAQDEHIVMPFDFLNINGNNVSFYVSQALNAIGKNMVLTSQDLSFEKTVQLAHFELMNNEVQDVLIGAVDESLENIEAFENYTSNVNQKTSQDGSCWFYANKNRENALGEIKSVKEFSSVDDILTTIPYKNATISLNQYTVNDEELVLALKENTIVKTDDFYGTEGALALLNLLKYEGKLLHIAKDKNNNYLVIELNR